MNSCLQSGSRFLLKPKNREKISQKWFTQLRRLWMIAAVVLTSFGVVTGQNHILDKKITLDVQAMTIADVLHVLEEQTGCTFVYSSTLLDTQRKVNARYQNISLSAALKELLGDVARGIYVQGTQINIRPVKGESRGNLKGSVQTSDGEPADFVNVQVKGTMKGTITNDRGEFAIKNLPAGKQILIIHLLGYEPIEIQVDIPADQTTVVPPVFIKEDSQTLHEVVIKAQMSRFNSKESDFVAKLPLKNLENPQVYSSLSKDLLAEQVITDLSDGLRNTPGIIKMQASIGRSGDGAVYYNLRGFPTRISMVDGIPAQTNGEFDLANIEKIEVIKGPSGTLYGGALTTFGGLINIVSKKPMDTFGGEIAYTMGSFNLNRISADVYGALNKSKTLTARMNVAYHNRDSFQDAGFRKSTFLAPVIDYRVNDRLRFSVGAEFYNYEGTNPSIVFLSRTRQFYARTPQQLNFDWKRSYTSNDITLQAPSSNVHGKADYKISGEWTSQTSFSRNVRKTDGMYQYEFVRGNASDDLLERNVQLQNSQAVSTSIQQNFTGDFRIGTLRNRVVIGLDYLNQNANNSNSPIVKFDTISGSTAAAKYVLLSRASAQAKITASKDAPTKNYTNGNIYSAYISNVLNITDRLLTMLSVRVDRFDSRGTFNQATNQVVPNSKYLQTAVSPKFGLTYQVIKDRVSIFGNYMNGFSNVAPVTQPLPDISGTFKPQQANQLEGGIKMELLKSRVSFTASYYDITVDNTIRVESLVRDQMEYPITVQNGTQSSKGIEIELLANPLPGLNFVGGYTHNNSKLIKSSEALEGRRPSSAGPADLVNVWLSYSLTNGKLKGLGLGFGGNYVSEHVTVNSATTGIFTFPSYTLLNSTAFYETRSYRLGLKFENMSNQQYFTGQGVVSPQLPRNFSANVTVKF